MQFRNLFGFALLTTLALAGCGGSSNSSPAPQLPPPTPAPTPTPTPAPVDTAFAPFVLNLINAQNNNTALPVDINGTTFTFTEDANAFNSVLAGP